MFDDLEASGGFIHAALHSLEISLITLISGAGIYFLCLGAVLKFIMNNHE
jgi:hypothetical protein